MTDVLVVVAAGPGLGPAVALRFAREGAAVGLVARATDRLDDLVAELRRAGAPAVAVGGRRRRPTTAALREAIGRAARAARRPATVLVFNGSAYVEGRTAELPLRRASCMALDVGVGAALVSRAGGRAGDARGRPRAPCC